MGSSSTSTSSSSVIVIGAGISGIVAAKVLAENGIEDFLILEAADRIGGRLMKHEFAGFTVECGAGWVAGVGGSKLNPIWELVYKHNLRTYYSDYSNAAFNIYDQSGARVPGSVAAACYQLAVNSANRAWAIEAVSRIADGTARANPDLPLQETKIQEVIPSTPLELAIDFCLHDFEMAEVEPIPTYTEFGAMEFLVADDRGYEYIVHKLAEEFLKSEGGHVIDDRLKLKKVVREIHYTDDGVTIKIEDGSVYSGKYAIVSVSLGVLQSDLIKFNPPLHVITSAAIKICRVGKGKLSSPAR